MTLATKKKKKQPTPEASGKSPLKNLNASSKKYIIFHPDITDNDHGVISNSSKAAKTLRPKSMTEDVHSARRKRSNRARRNHSKLQRIKRQKSNTMAHPEQIHRRAERLARKLIRQRHGTNYQSANAPEKNFSDHILSKKQDLINHVVQRLIPVIRRKEQRRLQAKRSGNPRKKAAKTDMATLNQMRIIEGLEYLHEDYNYEKLSNVSLGLLARRNDAVGRKAASVLKRRKAESEKSAKIKKNLHKAKKVVKATGHKVVSKEKIAKIKSTAQEVADAAVAKIEKQKNRELKKAAEAVRHDNENREVLNKWAAERRAARAASEKEQLLKAERKKQKALEKQLAVASQIASIPIAPTPSVETPKEAVSGTVEKVTKKPSLLGKIMSKLVGKESPFNKNARIERRATENRERARRMLAVGHDTDEIFQTTGWDLHNYEKEPRPKWKPRVGYYYDHQKDQALRRKRLGLDEDLAYLKTRQQKPKPQPQNQQQPQQDLASRGGAHGRTVKPHAPGAQSVGAGKARPSAARPVLKSSQASGGNGTVSPAQKIRDAALKAQKAHMQSQKAIAHSHVARIQHQITASTANRSGTMKTTANKK